MGTLKNTRIYLRWICDLAIIVAFVSILGVAWTSSAGSTEVDLSRMLAPMSWQHLLGTDALGRDLLHRLAGAVVSTVPLLWGAVVSGLVLGLSVATLRLSLIKAFEVVCRLFDVAASFAVAVPTLLTVFMATILFGFYGMTSLFICLLVLCALRFYGLCVREYQESYKLGYWQAHTAMGGSQQRLLWRYGILALWRSRLLSEIVHLFRFVVIVEIALSYLGFGVQEPKPSLGNILASHYDLFLRGELQLGLAILLMFYLVYSLPLACWRCLAGVRQRWVKPSLTIAP